VCFQALLPSRGDACVAKKGEVGYGNNWVTKCAFVFFVLTWSFTACGIWRLLLALSETSNDQQRDACRFLFGSMGKPQTTELEQSTPRDALAECLRASDSLLLAPRSHAESFALFVTCVLLWREKLRAHMMQQKGN
jgi:hypothetical protein